MFAPCGRSIRNLRRGFASPLSRRMLLGRFVSVIGDLMTPVALVFTVLQELDGAATDVGLVVGAALAGTASALLAGGIIADRRHPVAVMALADSARFVVQSAACLLVVSGAASVWQLAILAFARGAAGGISTPATQTAWPLIVPREDLLPVNAVMRILASIGVVAGPALAGVLLQFLNPGWVLGVDALTFLWSATLLGLVWRSAPTAPVSSANASSEQSSSLGELREGWRQMVAAPWVLGLVAQTTLVHLLIAGPLMTLAPAVAARSYDGAAGYALFLSAAGVGVLLGGALLLSWAPSRPLLVCASSMLLLAPAPMALALGLPLTLVCVGYLLAGAVESVSGTLADTALQQRLPPGAVARVSAYGGLVTLVALPLGVVLAGPVSELLGLAGTLIAMAVAAPLVTLPVLLVRDIRAASALDESPMDPAPSDARATPAASIDAVATG